MKIKEVRVINKGDTYYPQYKGWVFWRYFTYVDRETHAVYDIGDDGKRTIWFNNLKDAKEYAKDKMTISWIV